MRLVLLSACVAVTGLFALVERSAAATPLACPVQKARAVSFRDAAAKDVLEVSIGTGPCERATLTVVIRGDLGRIVYSYVAPFKQHVADWYVPELDKEARAFVERLLERGIGSSADLPPWVEPDAYDAKNSVVVVSGGL